MKTNPSAVLISIDRGTGTITVTPAEALPNGEVATSILEAYKIGEYYGYRDGYLDAEAKAKQAKLALYAQLGVAVSHLPAEIPADIARVIGELTTIVRGALL